MSNRDASIATRRFGLGARPGDLARIASDPRGYVLAGLNKLDAAIIDDPALESSSASYASLQDAQMAEQLARLMAKDAAPAAPATPTAPAAAAPKTAPPAAPQPQPPAAAAKPAAPAAAMMAPPKAGEVRRDVFQDEAAARLTRALTTDQPFVERLVMFWSNHFCISAAKGGGVRVMAGAFEREAIRPHVLGSFRHMLKAVEQHPAMLFYLDNNQSIGPTSPNGLNSKRGLNENLAREILELHTLGVDGGYTQTDVTTFAKIITGWGVTDARMVVAAGIKGTSPAGASPTSIVPGQFVFFPQRHEPGEQTLLGKRYADKGMLTGEEALDDLARHPATARHIARKLATHFVSQNPPQPLIDRLEKAFRDTDGNLAAVAKALVAAPECWQTPQKKVVPPYDYTVSLMRAFDFKVQPQEALRIPAAIGQPLWQPPSPKGWPDDDNAWMGPSAVRERLRIAERGLQILDRKADPRAAAVDLFGANMSAETTQAIARAESREQGFELLMMSPEFLRR